MIRGIHYFSAEVKTKIDVIPRGCFNIHIIIYAGHTYRLCNCSIYTNIHNNIIQVRYRHICRLHTDLTGSGSFLSTGCLLNVTLTIPIISSEIKVYFTTAQLSLITYRYADILQEKIVYEFCVLGNSEDSNRLPYNHRVFPLYFYMDV